MTSDNTRPASWSDAGYSPNSAYCGPHGLLLATCRLCELDAMPRVAVPPPREMACCTEAEPSWTLARDDCRRAKRRRSRLIAAGCLLGCAVIGAAIGWALGGVS